MLIELKEPVEGSREISATYTLSDRGTLRLPKLTGEIHAKGITPAALARRIEEAFRREGVFKNPSVSAYFSTITRPAVNVMTVIGEVQSPGELPWLKGTRLIRGIFRAGGMTKWADSSAVKLIRGNKTVVYDLRKIKEDDSNNPVLQDGDTVIVPAK